MESHIRIPLKALAAAYTGNQELLVLHLYRQIDQGRGSSLVSVSSLAEEVGCTRKEARTLISRLVGLELLDCVPLSGAGLKVKDLSGVYRSGPGKGQIGARSDRGTTPDISQFGTGKGQVGARSGPDMADPLSTIDQPSAGVRPRGNAAIREVQPDPCLDAVAAWRHLWRCKHFRRPNRTHLPRIREDLDPRGRWEIHPHPAQAYRIGAALADAGGFVAWCAITHPLDRKRFRDAFISLYDAGEEANAV